jgi:hypothetical protein
MGGWVEGYSPAVRAFRMSLACMAAIWTAMLAYCPQRKPPIEHAL